MTDPRKTCVSPLDDTIASGWFFIRRTLARDWDLLSTETIANINGNVSTLNAALTEAYDLTASEAQKIIETLAEEFNAFTPLPTTHQAMGTFWNQIKKDDFVKINGKKHALVTVLQDTYKLPRPAAWDQVNAFFAVR